MALGIRRFACGSINLFKQLDGLALLAALLTGLFLGDEN
jgi:hypothetical protein